MARNNTPQLVAGGNIYPSRFVVMSTAADNTCLQAGANGVILGVSGEGTEYTPIPQQSTTYHASAGKPVDLYASGDVCLVEAGDTVTRAQRVKADADGKAVAVATTGTTVQNVGGIALESAIVGDLFHIVVRHESVRPALT